MVAGILGTQLGACVGRCGGGDEHTDPWLALASVSHRLHRRGAFPVKFNGAIFNFDGRFDPQGQHGAYDADFRAWGGAYWFQNTRHVYWPLAAEGDVELMRPLFDMYLAALPLAEQRTKVYFNHQGAYFPETMHFWAPT